MIIFLFQNKVTANKKVQVQNFFVSMMMKKNSPLTPFVTFTVIRLLEAGIADVISKRHSIKGGLISESIIKLELSTTGPSQGLKIRGGL